MTAAPPGNLPGGATARSSVPRAPPRTVPPRRRTPRTRCRRVPHLGTRGPPPRRRGRAAHHPGPRREGVVLTDRPRIVHPRGPRISGPGLSPYPALLVLSLAHCRYCAPRSAPGPGPAPGGHHVTASRVRRPASGPIGATACRSPPHRAAVHRRTPAHRTADAHPRPVPGAVGRPRTGRPTANCGAEGRPRPHGPGWYAPGVPHRTVAEPPGRAPRRTRLRAGAEAPAGTPRRPAQPRRAGRSGRGRHRPGRPAPRTGQAG